MKHFYNKGSLSFLAFSLRVSMFSNCLFLLIIDDEDADLTTTFGGNLKLDLRDLLPDGVSWYFFTA